MGWEVVDYVVVYPPSVVSADGIALATVPTSPPSGQVWGVTGVVVLAVLAEGGQANAYSPCLLYDQDPTRGAQVPCGGTKSGVFDVADFASPLIIPGGSTMYIEWAGLPDGTPCFSRVQYELRQRTGAAAAPQLST